MPIKIPNDLPAFEKLQQEGVRLIGENEALRQDIRPMQVALLNLMPEKPKTETQLARLLGATPLQVELTLLTTSTYRPNTVPLSHLQSFYRTWDEVRERKFDGLIITGAPVEMLPFEEVKYWPELTRILDWSRTHVHSSLPHLLGRAGGALPLPRRAQAHPADQALRRVQPPCHRAARPAPRPPLMRGFDDYFLVPVSRHTEVRAADLPPEARARGAGGLERGRPVPGARARAPHRLHVQPPRVRHLHAARRVLPRPGDARRTCPCRSTTTPTTIPEKAPRNCWRAYAHLLFGNWINEMYQTTPYELARIGTPAQAQAA